MTRRFSEGLTWDGEMTERPTYDPSVFVGRLVSGAWEHLLGWARDPEDPDPHEGAPDDTQGRSTP